MQPLQCCARLSHVALIGEGGRHVPASNTSNTAVKLGQFVAAQRQKGRFFLANCLELPEQSSAQKEVDDQKVQEPRPKHRTCPSNKAFWHSLST